MSETYGTLECGHDLAVFEDTDPNGSEFCPGCGLWVRFVSFHTSRLTEEGTD